MLLALIALIASLSILAPPAATAATVNVSTPAAERRAAEPLTLTFADNLRVRGLRLTATRLGTGTTIDFGDFTEAWGGGSYNATATITLPTDGTWTLRVTEVERFIYPGTCNQTSPCTPTTWVWVPITTSNVTVTLAAARPTVSAAAPTVGDGYFIGPAVTPAGAGTLQWRYAGSNTWGNLETSQRVNNYGDFEVRLVANSTHYAPGTTSWSFNTYVPLTLSAPTADGQEITFPAQTDVTWYASSPVHGTTGTGTMNLPPALYTVSGSAPTKYRIVGPSSFVLDTRLHTTLAAPTVTGNTLTFPEGDHDVVWTIEGRTYQPGDVRRAYGPLAVSAALAGASANTHRAVGDTTWTLNLPARVPDSAEEPVATPGHISVPTRIGVVYEYRRSDRTRWSALTDPSVGYGHFDVRAVPEHPDDPALTGTTQWDDLDARLVLDEIAAPTSLQPQSKAISVPTTEGVTYLLNGEPVSAGTVAHTTDGVVTVRLDHGVVSTAPVPSWRFDHRTLVTAPAPGTNVDKTNVTIPSSSTNPGIEYVLHTGRVLPSNSTVSRLTDLVRIRPRALATHVLSNPDAVWTFLPLTDTSTLAAPRPHVDEATATVTIPAFPEARYVSATRGLLTPGTYRLQSPREEIRAESVDVGAPDAAPAHVRTWVFDGRPAHTPVGPTLQLDRAQVIAPTDPHFTYHLLSDTLLGSGATLTPLPTGVAVTVTDADAVVARPVDATTRIADGATSMWFLDYTDVTTVTPLTPVLDAAAQSLEIPFVAGVEYRVDGIAVPAGTRVLTQQAHVTAHPADLQYVVAGEDSWTFDARRSQVAPTPTIDLDGTHPTLTLPQVDGAAYRVDGAVLAPGTHRVTLPVHVELVVLDESVAYTGARSWTFARPATSTPTPTTAPKPTTTPEPTLTPTPKRVETVKARAPRWSARTGKLTLRRTAGVTYKVRITTRTPQRSGKATVRHRTVVVTHRTTKTRVIRLKAGQKATVRAVARPGHRLTGVTTWKVTRR